MLCAGDIQSLHAGRRVAGALTLKCVKRADQPQHAGRSQLQVVAAPWAFVLIGDRYPVRASHSCRCPCLTGELKIAGVADPCQLRWALSAEFGPQAKRGVTDHQPVRKLMRRSSRITARMPAY